MAARVLYTAEAEVTGGRDEGHARTSDGALEVDIRVPAELGGAGAGTNPEQLFAIGFASCFQSSLKLVARRMKLSADDSTIDSKVMLMPTEQRGFKLGVALDVTLPSIADEEQAQELVRTAHTVCPYSNATRGNIEVALSVNGEALD